MVNGLLALQAHNCNYLIIITHYLYIICASSQKCPPFPSTPFSLTSPTVPLSDSVKSLGLLLDSTLSMEKFISQTTKSCYYQLRRISSVRKYLSVEATVKLVTSLILSRLDYCNSLLSGLPASSVHSLRRIQNCAARLILRKRRTGNVIPLFQLLHWLPIQQRIPYKINTLCYKCITDTAPSYLCDCLQLYTPSRTLRTASDTLSLQRPRTRPHCWFPRLFCFWSINME